MREHDPQPRQQVNRTLDLEGETRKHTLGDLEGTTVKRIALPARQRSNRPEHPAFDTSLDPRQDYEREWYDDLLKSDYTVTGFKSHPHLQVGSNGSVLPPEVTRMPLPLTPFFKNSVAMFTQV